MQIDDVQTITNNVQPMTNDDNSKDSLNTNNSNHVEKVITPTTPTITTTTTLSTTPNTITTTTTNQSNGIETQVCSLCQHMVFLYFFFLKKTTFLFSRIQKSSQINQIFQQIKLMLYYIL